MARTGMVMPLKTNAARQSQFKMIQFAIGDMTIPPTLVPANATPMAVPLREVNQFEMTREQGMAVEHTTPPPISAKTMYSCQSWEIRLPASRPIPTMAAPVAMTDLAPIRSISTPASGAASADPTDPISKASAKAPRPQFMSMVIGLTKMGKVLRTIPQHRNRMKKQAVTTWNP